MLTTLHRFTPPTCTLEIKGKPSPLSRWLEQDLLKDLRFQLNFDDPRLPPDQQITVTGNKAQLEQLNKAVNSYIQHHLHVFLSCAQISSCPQIREPYLEPDGLVNHHLHLADLTNDAAENRVRLSTVQLFDLVTALEGYTEEIAALPTLSRSSRKVVPLWGAAAAVGIAAIGLGAIALKSPPQNVATSQKSNPPESIVELEEVIPPELPENLKASPQPQPNQSISSRKRLPPPPAVDSPKPKPNIPDPADLPLSEVKKRSGFENRVNKQPAIATPEKESDSTSTIVLEPTSEPTSEPKSEPKAEDAPPQPVEKVTGDRISSLSESGIAGDTDAVANKPATKPNPLREVNSYFRAKWQPPKDLKQSLEYRLFIGKDGSIKKVVSLGKAAKLYLSKTNIPVGGEIFISPVEEDLTVRLLLNPDGTVKVFAE